MIEMEKLFVLWTERQSFSDFDRGNELILYAQNETIHSEGSIEGKW